METPLFPADKNFPPIYNQPQSQSQSLPQSEMVPAVKEAFTELQELKVAKTSLQQQLEHLQDSENQIITSEKEISEELKGLDAREKELCQSHHISQMPLNPSQQKLATLKESYIDPEKRLTEALSQNDNLKAVTIVNNELLKLHRKLRDFIDTERALSNLPQSELDKLESEYNAKSIFFIFIMGRMIAGEVSNTLQEWKINEPKDKIKELSTSLSSPNPDFSKFNTVIDYFRAKTDWKEIDPSLPSNNWREVFQHLLIEELKRNETDLASFLGHFTKMHPRDFRGFDKDGLREIFIAIDKVTDLSTQTKIYDLYQTIFARVDLINLPSEQIKPIGKGRVGETFLLESQDGRTKRVFKPDSFEDNPLVAVKERFWGTACATGIPHGSEAHLACRAVASSRVDRLLNPNDPVSVETNFAVINGKRGILMQLAKGQSPKVNSLKGEEIKLDDYPEAWQLVSKEYGETGILSAETTKKLAKMLKYREVYLTKNDAGELILEGIRPQFAHQFNPLNPTTLERLILLQVLDIINGECDRHPGNYFVSDEGWITGIDQDCSFGINAIPVGMDVRKQPTLMGIIPNNGSLMLRMPGVITRNIKDRVDSLVQRREELIKELEPLIEGKEIAALFNRLARLKMHIDHDCLVVENKEDLIYPEALKRMNSNNSYAMRELLVFSSDKEGWNYLREYRDE